MGNSPGRNTSPTEVSATTSKSSEGYGGLTITAGLSLAPDKSENGKGSSTTAPRLKLVVVGIERVVPNFLENGFREALATANNFRIRQAGFNSDNFDAGIRLQRDRIIQHNVLAIKMTVQCFHRPNLPFQWAILKRFLCSRQPPISACFFSRQRLWFWRKKRDY